MTRNPKMLAVALFLLAGVCKAAADNSSSLGALQIVAIGAMDGRAVVKTTDNKMHVLKVGSVIPGTQATVVQILGDKLIVEDASAVEASGKGQTVWLTKSGPDGKVTVQRLQHSAPPSEIREVSGVKMIETEKSNKKDAKKND